MVRAVAALDDAGVGPLASDVVDDGVGDAGDDDGVGLGATCLAMPMVSSPVKSL